MEKHLQTLNKHPLFLFGGLVCFSKGSTYESHMYSKGVTASDVFEISVPRIDCSAATRVGMLQPALSELSSSPLFMGDKANGGLN
jgi:hypothetical protein